jgi:hypothetical protein
MTITIECAVAETFGIGRRSVARVALVNALKPAMNASLLAEAPPARSAGALALVEAGVVVVEGSLPPAPRGTHGGRSCSRRGGLLPRGGAPVSESAETSGRVSFFMERIADREVVMNGAGEFPPPRRFALAAPLPVTPRRPTAPGAGADGLHLEHERHEGGRTLPHGGVYAAPPS